MLKDGVCDEVTNIERCLYDGGDCCSDKKDTNLCSTCSCKIDFDQNALHELYKDLKVQAFENIADFDELFTDIQKSVDDVETMDTCSYICMDESLLDLVNSWSYNFDTEQCQCTWVDIDASLCSKNVITEAISDYEPEVWYSFKVGMLRLHDTIPCGRYFF